MKYVVEKDKILSNLKVLEEHCGSSKIIAVIKADGYGLGLCNMASILREGGSDFFGVARLEEAVALRDAGFENDILLLSPATCEASAELVCEKNIISTVDNAETARLLSLAAQKTQRKARAHFIVDTGFGRYGFSSEEAENIIGICGENPDIDFEGIYTHFFNPFSKDSSSVDAQVRKFNSVVMQLESAGITGLMKHVCSSSAAVKYPQYHFDAVRIGSALLGRILDKRGLALKEVGCLESEILSIKELPAGHNLGYGQVYITKRKTLCAVIPAGITDGVGIEKADVSFGFKQKVFAVLKKVKRFNVPENINVEINGKRYPVIGRVGLTDMFADITGSADIKIGDTVRIPVNPILLDSSVEKEIV